MVLMELRDNQATPDLRVTPDQLVKMVTPDLRETEDPREIQVCCNLTLCYN